MPRLAATVDRAPVTQGRVEHVTTVSSEIAEQFVQLYRDAFAPLETRAPARQWLTDDEFRQDMVDPSVLKFVARDRSGEVVAMATMATDLANVPWISQPYFKARFPEHFEAGNLYYFGALLVRVDKQGGPWATFLMQDIFKLLEERRAVAAFDCCGFNVDVVKLPGLLTRASRNVAEFALEELDVQRYYAFTYERKR
jgi:hypothetical protein